MKNVLKITGITAFAIALFFTVSLTGESNSNNIDLASLTKINDANAECPYERYGGGNCSWTNRCYHDITSICKP